MHALLTLCLTATLLFAASAQAAETRCFELRTYTAGPGKLGDLHARFRNHTTRLFEKHGMTNIGYWVPVENTEQKLIYLMAYPSRAAREESWKAFRGDPAWQAIKAASDAQGPLAAKVEEQFFEPVDFSPEIKSGLVSRKRVFELRTYTATEGNLDRLVERSRNNTEWLFSKYGIGYLGIWTPAAEKEKPASSLLYLLTHPSVTAGEEAWRRMAADKEWAAIKDASESVAGGPLVKTTHEGITSVYLEATDYSPLR